MLIGGIAVCVCRKKKYPIYTHKFPDDDDTNSIQS